MGKRQTKKNFRKKKLPSWMERQSDTVVTVEGATQTDIIIPVMGPTGVGKSTFINAAVGRTVTQVGHDLRSCTAEIQHFIVPNPGNPSRRIVFVDTPGFDDTYVDDAEILRRIAVWLARSYYDGMKLAGIIYLHEISQARMFGTARKNLAMFNKLCGDEALKNVILVTTKWGDIEQHVGRRREQQLSDTYWKEMLAQGSTMARFGNSRESAWAIVDPIVKKDPGDDPARIQEELVYLQKILPETEAGKTLRYTLQELLEAQKEMARQLQEEDGNEGLQEKQEEVTKKLRSTLHQIRELKVPLGRRILAFFF